jgi:hypothetical protein
VTIWTMILESVMLKWMILKMIYSTHAKKTIRLPTPERGIIDFVKVLHKFIFRPLYNTFCNMDLCSTFTTRFAAGHSGMIKWSIQTVSNMLKLLIFNDSFENLLKV